MLKFIEITVSLFYITVVQLRFTCKKHPFCPLFFHYNLSDYQSTQCFTAKYLTVTQSVTVSDHPMLTYLRVNAASLVRSLSVRPGAVWAAPPVSSQEPSIWSIWSTSSWALPTSLLLHYFILLFPVHELWLWLWFTISFSPPTNVLDLSSP